jgi:chromosome condensin MukBEF complex kleisin-like MukF subunit
VSFVDFSETVSFSVLLIVFVDFSVSLRVETLSFVLVISVGFMLVVG